MEKSKNSAGKKMKPGVIPSKFIVKLRQLNNHRNKRKKRKRNKKREKEKAPAGTRALQKYLTKDNL